MYPFSFLYIAGFRPRALFIYLFIPRTPPPLAARVPHTKGGSDQLKLSVIIPNSPICMPIPIVIPIVKFCKFPPDTGIL